MPLVVMCGVPSSGKTKRARQIAEDLRSRGKTVEVMSEAEEIASLHSTKEGCFADQNVEKQLRASLKAKAINVLDANITVILDSGNYIKGFRYELYCASKACKTTQCTIFTIFNVNEAFQMNQQRQQIPSENQDKNNIFEQGRIIENLPYSKETFDALVLRFEEPNAQSRWDSPLFIVQSDEEPNFSDIYSALYEKKPPPPNMSTQNPPLSSTNFLYELDRVIQEISKEILDNKKISPNSAMKFSAYPSSCLDADSVEAIQPAMLHRLKRQFITFAKMQYSNHDPKQIGSLYIQYINTSLQKC